MKTILAATDFSDNARNAVNYAAEIAKLTNAKLILFHVYHIPVVPTDAPVVIIPSDEIENESQQELKKIGKNIHIKHGAKLKIECVSRLGFAVDEINQFVNENNIDLVVMGMNGGNYLKEKLIGSTTTTIIRKAKYPVLVINKYVKFKSIKKMVFASDYEKISHGAVLNTLEKFVKLFKSRLYILNVAQELEAMSPIKKTLESKRYDAALEGIDHTFHFTENEDTIDGINEFVDEQKIDMIVMIPRKHSFLETIFNEGNTQKMAFHTHIPLLTLHE